MSLLVIGVWTTILAIFHTRDPLITGVGTIEYRRVINASMTTCGLLATAFLVAQADTARWFITVSFPLGIGSLVLSRWIWRQWLNGQRADGLFQSRVVVVGTRAEVEKVVRQINASSGAAYTVVGAVLESDGPGAGEGVGVLHDINLVFGLEQTTDYAEALGADAVVVAGQPHDGSDFIHDLAWKLEGRTVQLILATSLANVAGPRVHFRPVDGLPLLHVEIPQFEGGKHVLKRVLDIAVSGTALLAALPALPRARDPHPDSTARERRCSRRSGWGAAARRSGC